MKLEKTRSDFAFLKKGNPIYFDNACSSLRPEAVVEKIRYYYEHFPVCAGRSNFLLAEELGGELDDTRKAIARFVGAKEKSEIIFTKNTTEAINLLAKTFPLKKGDTILIGDKEHNSNLVPWQKIAKEKDLDLKIVKSNPDNTFNIENFKKNLNDRVALVALGLTSNLDGLSLPLKEITKEAHKAGAKIFFDAAQSMLHIPIDVDKDDVDFLAFSGHKMLAASGTGVFYGKKDHLEKLNSFMLGGSTVTNTYYESYEPAGVPENFEAGLQDFAGILSLGEAVKYISKLDYKKIKKHEEHLLSVLIKALLEIPGLKLIGPQKPSGRAGIVSFYFDDINSHEISLMLDRNAGIMVRSGRHCVHSWFNDRGIKDSLRVSLSFYNTEAEVDIFIAELNKIVKILK